MHVLSYETYFSAAHYVKGHKKCGKVHGHNFKVYVEIWEDDDEFIDFHELKEAVESILNELDHENITDKFGISTAEELSMWIFDKLTETTDFKVNMVKVCETPKFCASYWGD